MSRLAENRVEKSDIGRKFHLMQIAVKLEAAGLSQEFVTRVFEAARRYEGIADMMELWDESETIEERDEIIIAMDEESSDLDGIKDPPLLKPKLDFGELEGTVAQIIEFKENLRAKVDRWGGINKLAKASGIPQPSLSRFFKDASMPRRTTLYKIANAMNLSESEIRAPWSR